MSCFTTRDIYIVLVSGDTAQKNPRILQKPFVTGVPAEHSNMTMKLFLLAGHFLS